MIIQINKGRKKEEKGENPHKEKQNKWQYEYRKQVIQYKGT